MRLVATDVSRSAVAACTLSTNWKRMWPVILIVLTKLNDFAIFTGIHVHCDGNGAMECDRPMWLMSYRIDDLK